MQRKLLAGLVVAASLAVAMPARAQAVGQGYMDIGPVVGFGGLDGGAGSLIGGRLEKVIMPLDNFGGGLLGIQVGFGHYSWSYQTVSASTTVIAATANYHFKISNDKLDAFIGLGLGDAFASCSYSGINCPGLSTGIYPVARAGIRYFVQEKIALYGDVGAGTGSLNVGAMFKLK